MSFSITDATRVGISPLIVAYSESGCGKTFTSLLLARGIAGKNGLIVVADSESRRASLYADISEIGGFKTFDLCEPFSPSRYVEAIDTIESSGAAIGIIDSGSHEWEGPSGVLDMASEIEAKTGKQGLHCWRTPKLEHAKFVQRLLRSKIPFIVCLRAKYKSRQTKDERGKTVIIKDDHTSPIAAEDFIFEATCHFEILPNHSIVITKCSHPTLRNCFPEDKTSAINIEHGQKLAQWCRNAGTSVQPKSSELDLLKKELFTLSKAQKGDMSAFEKFCWSLGVSPEKDLKTLTVIELETLIVKAKDKAENLWRLSPDNK